jgi:hypothetical protein
MPLTLRSKPHRYVQVVAMGAKVVHARRVSNQGSTMCGEPIGPRHRATNPKKYDQGDEVTVDGDTILDLVAIAEHYLKIAVAAAPPPPDEHLIVPEPEPEVMVAPEPGEEVKPWVPTVEELTDFNSGRIQITPETARAMLPAAGAGLALAEEAAEPDDADHQWVIDQMRAAIKRLTEIVNS